MNEERVNVGRIMEQIRERVAEKKAAGLYREEEIEEITRMELGLQEREGYGEEMDRLLSWLHAHWEASGPVDDEGAGLPRPGRETVKKALRLLLSLEARLLLAKQNQINAKLVQLLSGSLPPLRDVSRDLEERVDGLALRLEKEHRQMRQELKEISARLERLEGR